MPTGLAYCSFPTPRQSDVILLFALNRSVKADGQQYATAPCLESQASTVEAGKTNSSTVIGVSVRNA